MPEQKMINALQTGQVQAIVATQPYILQAEKNLGAVAVLDSCSGVTAGLPLLGYFSTDAFATGHSQAVRAFRSALLQTLLTSSKVMNEQDAALLTLGQYPTFLSLGQVQRVADLMYVSGLIAT